MLTVYYHYKSIRCVKEIDKVLIDVYVSTQLSTKSSGGDGLNNRFNGPLECTVHAACSPTPLRTLYETRKQQRKFLFL